jgi:hypothetical protein
LVEEHKDRRRLDQAVRYALVVPLRTDATDIDLYTPVAKLLQVSVE